MGRCRRLIIYSVADNPEPRGKAKKEKFFLKKEVKNI